ncbi:MAG: DUF1553 domain-containing protein, partial [Planctomycetales bacterium]|nr:DUF1553 domain-containing protein [Planctomycetales bacterium]
FVTYDGSSQATGIKIYVDGQPQPWTASQDRLDATIQTDKPLTLGRRHPGSPFVGQLDDVRFYGRALSQDEVESLMRDASIFEILAVDPAQRTDRQLAALREHFLRTEDESGKKLYQEVSTVEAQLRGADYKPPTVMVMRDVPQMRMTYVLDRGSYDAPNKDQPVQPGVPAMLPPLASDAAPNRLGLARWLVRPDHPLTPRVTVNRYWQMLFGTGLVKTAEDFGSQGDWPSHPDLLDWLAVDFVEHGWDIKRTLKQMVMSATYRQSSRATRPLFQRDAENRLLARGPRFRLDGEFIRDTALAASGLLVPTVGGAGVKPYQPPGLWNEVSIDAGLRFSQDHGDKLYRRSMYTYWKRSAPAPSMAIFDV